MKSLAFFAVTLSISLTAFSGEPGAPKREENTSPWTTTVTEFPTGEKMIQLSPVGMPAQKLLFDALTGEKVRVKAEKMDQTTITQKSGVNYECIKVDPGLGEALVIYDCSFAFDPNGKAYRIK